MNKKGNGLFITIFFILVGLVGFILLLGFDYVPAGNVGVTDTLGSVGEVALSPGVHWTGVTTSTKSFSTRTQRADFEASAASRDLQIVSTTVVINFIMKPEYASKIYLDTRFDFQRIILQPAVQEAIKSSTSQFTAEELITKRPQVRDMITQIIVDNVEERGFIITDVAITDLDFSDEFNRAIEQKQTAEQEALKALNQKRTAVTQAEARAEQVKLEADANAYSTRANAEAEAYALMVVRQELEKSDQLVQYRAVEKWSGKLPNFYTTGSSSNMLFNLPVQEE